MTKNSESGSTPRPSKRVRLPQMKYPDASHPIFSNPTVIGSRANLMRSMPKAVDALEETGEDGLRDEPDKKSAARPSLKALNKGMRFPDASHPIYSNPTVVGSRANLMRSMPRAVDTSEETEEDGPLDEPDKKSTKQHSERGLPKEMIYPDASDPIFSNPTVIGSRANLMRSMPKAVDASKGTTASPSTPSASETSVGRVTAISHTGSPVPSHASVTLENSDGERVHRSVRVDDSGTICCEGVDLRMNDRIRYTVSHVFPGIIVWFEVLEPAEPEEMEDPPGPESPNKKAL